MSAGQVSAGAGDVWAETAPASPPFEYRMIDALGPRPLATAAVTSALVMMTFLAPAFLLGLPVLAAAGQNGLPLNTYSWAALVVSLMAGYAVAATAGATYRQLSDYVALDGVVPRKSAADLAADWHGATLAVLPRARAIGLLVMPLGVLPIVFMVPGAAHVLFGSPYDGTSGPPQTAAILWYLVCTVSLIGVLGWAMTVALRHERFLAALARHDLDFDPLDLAPLQPFTRIGLRNAFIWSVGASVTALFFVSSEIEAWAVFPLMVAIAAMAAFALIAPMRTVHRVIRRRKHAALAEVRAAIRGARDELLGEAEGSGEAGSRLAGLIAYERRLMEAREWPIDFPTVINFSLYLALPLGSWMGAALVERALALAID